MKNNSIGLRLKKERRKYDRLRKELARVGYLWVGTVLKRSMPCGRKECGCSQDPGSRHGPYYYWTRKVKGKTVSKLLNPAEGKLYMEWAGNRKKLQRTLDRMYAISRRMAPLILARSSSR